MGQHRLQPPAMGAKHHHLNNAAHMRKLLIWSLGIVVPFLLLFCIFPSSTSLYKPSYNRIVVSQLQVPASRFQSGVPEPDDDDPATVEELPSNDDDHSRDDDDDDDDSTSENVKKQSDGAATVAENSVPSNADSLPKATKKESKIKEPEASIIEVVDRPLPAASKAKKQNLETSSESLSADEGDHSSSKAKKQSNGDEKETQSDSYEKRKRSNGDNKLSDALPTKAKKVKDGEGGDHDFSIRKAKKPSDAQEQMDDELNLSSKKAKQQTRGDGDEPEINAFMIEEEQNGELKEENQNKKKTGDSETKKNVKKGKITEEMSEVELGEAFSISGKEEADQPNITHIEIKKSTKKAKAMHDTDEVVEESIARTKKADRNDEGPSTAEPSRKEKDEENLSTLGKESSLEEDPATSSKFTKSKKSSRKAMDTSYDKEAAGFTQMGKKGKSVAKLGKSSDGGKSSAEDSESDVLFLKDADNEAFLTEPKKKKRTQNGSDLEEMEDADFNNRSNYSPGISNRGYTAIYKCLKQKMNQSSIGCSILPNPSSLREARKKIVKERKLERVTITLMNRALDSSISKDSPKWFSVQSKSNIFSLSSFEVPSENFDILNWVFHKTSIPEVISAQRNEGMLEVEGFGQYKVEWHLAGDLKTLKCMYNVSKGANSKSPCIYCMAGAKILDKRNWKKPPNRHLIDPSFKLVLDIPLLRVHICTMHGLCKIIEKLLFLYICFAWTTRPASAQAKAIFSLERVLSDIGLHGGNVKIEQDDKRSKDGRDMPKKLSIGGVKARRFLSMPPIDINHQRRQSRTSLSQQYNRWKCVHSAVVDHADNGEARSRKANVWKALDVVFKYCDLKEWRRADHQFFQTELDDFLKSYGRCLDKSAHHTLHGKLSRAGMLYILL